jgi:hypothetical protein
MADEEMAEPEEQPKTEEAGGFDADAFKAEVAKDIESRFKKEISGLNRRNSELEKELEEARKKEMSKEERLEFERKKVEQMQSELTETRAGLLRSNIAAETGLGSKAIEFLTGSDEETIRDRAAKLKALIDLASETKTKAEIEQRFKSSPRPAGGSPSGELTYEDILGMDEDQLSKFNPKEIAAIINKASG